MKFRLYKGETLYNVTVTLKIDGIRAHNTPDGPVSRSNKPLYNLKMPKSIQVAEIFAGTWEETVTAVRTIEGTPVPKEYIYSLSPKMDERLIVGEYDRLTFKDVETIFRKYKKDYEGLVLYSDGKMYKVKDKETYDVEVTDIQPGKGKHEGRMGALITTMGKVGTGFTDAVREEDWQPGMIIEVECMELTPAGKFRHPRFVRRRYDKE